MPVEVRREAMDLHAVEPPRETLAQIGFAEEAIVVRGELGNSPPIGSLSKRLGRIAVRGKDEALPGRSRGSRQRRERRIEQSCPGISVAVGDDVGDELQVV